MKHALIVLLLASIWNIGLTQKSITATRVTEAITIDGIFDEPAWESAELVSDFMQFRPKPGIFKHNTEVKLIYDDEALYISAYMQDVSRDSIMTQLTERDDLGNTDFMAVIIDTYGNATEGFEFIVGSTGVQFDAKISPYNEDTNWDAVWFSAVHLTDEGWYCEFAIPYSALRFPNKKVQEWNINFTRRRAVDGTQNSWAEMDLKNDSPFLTNIGKLEGIQDIKPPLRLSFSPYASTYFQHSHDVNRDPVNTSGYSYNGGMDVKYGINDAFTLDMTLIPDFGQVQSDDQVLNLTPFEVRFDEQRQFFTEGTELFNKANLFYSRRVGGNPIGMYDVYDNITDDEEVVQNPQNSQLYNATKISGRTSKGTGLGIFNAISAETHATIRTIASDAERQYLTAPLTNYNVFVLDQNLRNNSSVSFSNTSVWRNSEDFHNANVSALTFNLKNPSQSWGVEGSSRFSQLLHKEAENTNGHNSYLSIDKLSGNVNLGVFYRQVSKDYNQNDLGFQRNANYRDYGLYLNYKKFDGLWFFNQFQSWFNAEQSRLYEPGSFIGNYFNAGFWGQAKNFWSFNMFSNYNPESNDFFEPRVDGRFSKRLSSFNIGTNINSDYRKPFHMYFFGFYSKGEQDGRYTHDFGFGPRYRFSDRFTLRTYTSFSNSYNSEGFVDQVSDDEIIYGRRDVQNISNIISGTYSFNEKQGLDLRLRHYWSKVQYNSFHELMPDGYLGESDYSSFNDFSFNSLALDLVYKWRFAPGSDIFLVWKNNILGFDSDETVDYSSFSYTDSVRQLGDLAQNNSLSMRIVYYIDYNRIKNVF